MTFALLPEVSIFLPSSPCTEQILRYHKGQSLSLPTQTGVLSTDSRYPVEPLHHCYEPEVTLQATVSGH